MRVILLTRLPFFFSRQEREFLHRQSDVEPLYEKVPGRASSSSPLSFSFGLSFESEKISEGSLLAKGPSLRFLLGRLLCVLRFPWLLQTPLSCPYRTKRSKQALVEGHLLKEKKNAQQKERRRNTFGSQTQREIDGERERERSAYGDVLEVCLGGVACVGWLGFCFMHVWR